MSKKAKCISKKAKELSGQTEQLMLLLSLHIAYFEHCTARAFIQPDKFS
jgi:hypothetical protein